MRLHRFALLFVAATFAPVAALAAQDYAPATGQPPSVQLPAALA